MKKHISEIVYQNVAGYIKIFMELQRTKRVIKMSLLQRRSPC